MALLAWAASAIWSVRAPASPCSAKCSSAACRMREAVAWSSVFGRPRLILVVLKSRSQSHAHHHLLVIPKTRRRALWSDFLQPLHIGRGERNIRRSQIVVQILAPLGPGNGND